MNPQLEQKPAPGHAVSADFPHSLQFCWDMSNPPAPDVASIRVIWLVDFTTRRWCWLRDNLMKWSVAYSTTRAWVDSLLSGLKPETVGTLATGLRTSRAGAQWPCLRRSSRASRRAAD